MPQYSAPACPPPQGLPHFPRLCCTMLLPPGTRLVGSRAGRRRAGGQALPQGPEQWTAGTGPRQPVPPCRAHWKEAVMSGPLERRGRCLASWNTISLIPACVRRSVGRSVRKSVGKSVGKSGCCHEVLFHVTPWQQSSQDLGIGACGVRGAHHSCQPLHSMHASCCRCSGSTPCQPCPCASHNPCPAAAVSGGGGSHGWPAAAPATGAGAGGQRTAQLNTCTGVRHASAYCASEQSPFVSCRVEVG